MNKETQLALVEIARALPPECELAIQRGATKTGQLGHGGFMDLCESVHQHLVSLGYEIEEEHDRRSDSYVIRGKLKP